MARTKPTDPEYEEEISHVRDGKTGRRERVVNEGRLTT